MMRRVSVIIALGGLPLGFACGNPSGPHSGINIVSGANLSDTVLSTFKPPLTVVLLDGDRQPMSGQTVYFNTNGFVLVAPIDDPGFVIDRLPVITDASGYASVWSRRSNMRRPGRSSLSLRAGNQWTYT